MMDEIEVREMMEQLMQTMREQLKYYRTYTAKVAMNLDLLGKGFVALEVVELQASDPLTYIIAKPVGSPRGFIPSKVGDPVILFFADADPQAARYISDPPLSMIESKPVQTVATLFESAMVGSSIKCDEIAGFTIESKSPAGLIASPEPVVLGNKAKALYDFIMDILMDIYTRMAKIDQDIVAHNHSSPVGPTSSTLPPVTVKRTVDEQQIGVKKGELTAKKSQYAIIGQLLSPTNKVN